MQFLRRSWAEISISALQHNINMIRSKLPAGTQIMAVVKADAYGHGHDIVCRLLNKSGIDHFAVSNLNEAVEIREICPDSEILILGYTPCEYAQLIEQYNIIQGVLSLEYAKMLSANASKKIRCHIKIDTGMGRIGLRHGSPADCAAEAAEIAALDKLCVEGLYTHFAVADTDNEECNDFTKKQADFIKSVADIMKNKMGIDLKHVHFMNSAASINHTDPASTLAREGIILYGLQPNSAQPLSVPLRPVMSLRSVVSQVKRIPAGVSLSYGRTFVSDREMDVATVTIGYADGYPRALSNKGEVLIHGTRCPVLGRVCMDQIMVDVSAVPSTVKPNDEVTLFGKDGSEEITADQIADLVGTIGYEIVCGISKRVPRIIKD